MYPNQEEESRLWQQFLDGNQGALSKIYLTNVNDLYSLGCKYSVDKSVVKDCIHDLFVTLIQSRTKLAQIDNVKAYLFTSLKRRILRESLCSNKFEKIVERGDYRFEIGFERLDADTFENDNYSKKTLAVRSALESLTSRQKEALYLRFYFGLSHKEIADVLHLEEQSSRSLISRAIKKVRNVMKSDKKRIKNFVYFLFCP